MDGLSLRPYQRDVVADVRKSVVKHGRTVLQSTTGAGKSRIAKWILGAAAEKNPSGRYGFFVHRRGLVDNISDSFNEEPGLNHGVIMSQREGVQGKPIQVGSIDSILAWMIDGIKWNSDYTFDVIVFDEAHSHAKKLIRMATAMDAKRAELGLKPCMYIGLTATPESKDIGWFKDIVNGPSPKWMQDNGYAANFTYWGGKEGQLGMLVRRGKDFTKESVAAAMDGLAGDLVRDWRKYADGVPTLGFFPRRDQAKAAQLMLTENGVRAEYVDGQTKDEDRQSIYRQINRMDIDYICNVGVIERGIDLAVGCVQLCTAVGTRSRFIQMIGRIARVNENAPDAIVIDHGGNVMRHGFWEDDREWSLEDPSKFELEEGERPVINCPGCGRIYRGGMCSACGYEPHTDELKEKGLLFDGGELKKITKVDRKPSTMTSEEVYISALYAAGRSGRTCAQAIGIAKSIAHKKGIDFRIPRTFNMGGETLHVPPYGSPETKKRVSDVFGWTAR